MRIFLKIKLVNNTEKEKWIMESEAHKKSNAIYRLKKRKCVTINLFTTNEIDMIVYNHWKSQKSPKKYITSLIIKDIEEKKKGSK